MLHQQNDTDAHAQLMCGQLHGDGLIFVTGVSTGDVKMWEVLGRKMAGRLEGHEGGARCVSLSENGYYLASGDGAGSVRLWDLRKLKPVSDVKGE